ncbi:3-phosphoshikimate 1-carboxyvinyltransferase, partial [Patescibacteria group bacterium]|nr:3-phosphoshikimate 1-carboxyvinyltransferase [Patescibacteria group bacterium]
PLFSDDTKYTIEALKKLGVEITRVTNNKLEIQGTGGNFKNPNEPLFLGNAGTGIRFITALLSLTNFKTKITGNRRMQHRPIQDLVTALKDLGIQIETINKDGSPPVKIQGGNFKGGEIEMDGRISSQFLSAILMIGSYSEKGVVINIKGDLVSKPYVDITIDIMSKFGVHVSNEDYRKFTIKSGQRYESMRYLIEGDASSASYFFALSALHQIPLNITNIPMETKQADIRFLNILEKMGCTICDDERGIQIAAPSSLKALGEIDLNSMPDAAMTVSIMAAFAEGKTKLTNLSNLKIKESNRIAALVTELRKVGVKCKDLDNGIEIDGDPMHNHGHALISTYRDHRMAMCFSILASKIKDIQILDPECISKTYPDFFKDLKKTGIKVEMKNIPNIALTGMRGSGKTRLGKTIAKKLHKTFVDTDATIEEQEKMTIPEIIKKHDWAYFREKEKYAIQNVSKIENVVIGTGGGAIIDKDNEKNLKQNATIIFLKCDLDTLEARLIKQNHNRPALTDKRTLREEIEEIWEKRKDRYIESADIIYDVAENIKVDRKAENIIMEI